MAGAKDRDDFVKLGDILDQLISSNNKKITTNYNLVN